MLHNHFLLYFCGYETHRNSPAIGRSPHLSNAPDRERQIQSGDCRYFRNFKNVCEPMVPVIPEERENWACSQESTRATSETFCQRESQTFKIALKGSIGFGLFNGFMDTRKNLAYDEKEDEYRISSPSLMENPEKDELDLPEAGTKSLAAKRKRHRKLEAVPMAAYKKTLNDLGATWCLRTKAGSFLRQMLSIPGLRKVKRRISITGLNKTKFPLSARFPFLQFGKERVSSFALNVKTLPVKISSSFFSIFSSICKGISFLSGTAAQFIEVRSFRRFYKSIQEFMFLAFRLTHQNSIRLNISGLNLIPIWQMDDLGISISYQRLFANQPKQGGVLNHYCALVCIVALSFVNNV